MPQEWDWDVLEGYRDVPGGTGLSWGRCPGCPGMSQGGFPAVPALWGCPGEDFRGSRLYGDALGCPGAPGWSRCRWRSPPAPWRRNSGTAAPQRPRGDKNGSERHRRRGEDTPLLVPALLEQLESQELSGRTSKVAGIVFRGGVGNGECRAQKTPNQGTSPTWSGLLHPLPQPTHAALGIL